MADRLTHRVAERRATRSLYTCLCEVGFLLLWLV